MIDFTLVDGYAEQRNILYAFAVDGDLVYIGKSTQALKKRMLAYKCPAKGSAKAKNTNEANHRRIREQLDRGREVKILALCPDGHWSYRGVRIDLAAAMEEDLIHELAPAWNLAGNKTPKRYGVMGGRRGQQLLKLWLDSPLVDKMQELATRKGNSIVVEMTEAIIKHVRQNGVGPLPKKDEAPKESKEPT